MPEQLLATKADAGPSLLKFMDGLDVDGCYKGVDCFRYQEIFVIAWSVFQARVCTTVSANHLPVRVCCLLLEFLISLHGQRIL